MLPAQFGPGSDPAACEHAQASLEEEQKDQACPQQGETVLESSVPSPTVLQRPVRCPVNSSNSSSSSSLSSSSPSPSTPPSPKQYLFTSTARVQVKFRSGYDGHADQILNLNDKFCFTYELLDRFLNLFIRPVSISYQVRNLESELIKTQP